MSVHSRTQSSDRRRISSETILALVRQIVADFEPEKVILFGSYAYGNPNQDSDVDMLVIMETALRNREQAAQISRALDYHFGLDLLVRTPQQIEERLELGDFFLQEVMQKGKVLYARPDPRMG